jgi:hypothetical protein
MKLTSLIKERYFEPKGTPGTKAKDIKIDLLGEPEDQDDSYDFDTLKNVKKDIEGKEVPVDWSGATDDQIRAIGGDVYYGDVKNKKPVKGRERMIIPPKKGWPRMKKENKIKLNSLIKEIGFRDKASKSVDDVTADKFEDFGVTVGQLYQTFLKKDISADPAVAQKIMNMVDTDDDNVLMNQIKDLEFLINQLPDKIEKKDKIGFKETAYRPKGEDPDKGAEIKTNNIKLGKLIPEANMPINSPIDLIDNDILDIPDGDVGEIKKAAAKLGIDPQNKYESELRDEIDDLLTRGMSTYEEYELVKKYFGDYADELIHQYGLQIDEVNEDDRSEKDKAFDLAQQLDKLNPEDKETIKKIQQLIAKEKNEEKINGFDYHYQDVMNAKRPRIVNEILKETLKRRAGIIK